MLRPAARTALSVTLALALGAQGLAPAAAFAASAAAIEVKVGSAAAFSRIELHGPRPALRRDGDAVIARYARGEAPDIARLHVAPPPHLQSVEARPVGGGVELRFTPAADAIARTGEADGATWINFALRPPPAAAPAPGPGAGADPVPASGVVKMSAKLQGGALVLQFPWRAPLAAAVFRRGPAVWIVFDAKAKLDLSAAPHGLLQAKSFTAVDAGAATALRIVTPPGVQMRADAAGGVWTVALSAQALAPHAVDVERAPGAPAALEAQLPGATRAVWIADPAVGDRLAVAPAATPGAGVTQPRAFIEGAVLPSVQGLAVASAVDDLTVTVMGDKVRISRPRGLALSAQASGAPAALVAAGGPAPPGPAVMPALIDPAWGAAPGGFEARYQALLDGASRETAGGANAGVQARLGLARFLVGSGLSFEAIGVLDSLLKASPTLGEDAGFRGLRGAARAMARRWKDAQADFSTAATADDPASALWRAYAAAELGDAAGARPQFALGREAIGLFAPKWRARFAAADAQTALAVGDLASARSTLAAVDGPLEPDEQAAIQLAQARLAEASGQGVQAMALYQQASDARNGAIAAPARLALLRLRLAARQVSPADAAVQLDALRFLWRGDAAEIETIRELGRLDIAQGRYREALEAMRSAGSRLPDLPASVALRTDLSGAFKTLFLDGRADGMEPIQALALFYDFKELTPVGADGDLMVRRLVKRLVGVDLLDQAADLLKYQVDNRLQGVGKAEVATDLAAIQLMAGKPEAAIEAVESSRTTLLPTPLNVQRRLLEARALVMMGRYDHALEMIGKDASPDALEIRAEAAWKAKDWAAAGRWAEARLGDRWRSLAPLTPDEAALLIRTGSAYTLAKDDAGLARLRQRYGALAQANPQRDALGVAMAGLDGDGLPAGVAPGALARQQIGDADLLAGWVMRMKARLSQVGVATAAADPPPPPPARPGAPRRA